MKLLACACLAVATAYEITFPCCAWPDKHAEAEVFVACALFKTSHGTFRCQETCFWQGLGGKTPSLSSFCLAGADGEGDAKAPQVDLTKHSEEERALDKKLAVWLERRHERPVHAWRRCGCSGLMRRRERWT